MHSTASTGVVERAARRGTQVLAPSRDVARALAFFAIAAQLVYVAAWIVAGAVQPGYSQYEQAISELGARNAAHPWIVGVGTVVLGLSAIALALGLLRVLPERRASRVAAACFAIAGIAFVLLVVFPLDCAMTVDQGCVDRFEAGQLSTAHSVHLWLALVVQLALSVTPFAVARALWPGRAAVVLLPGAVAGVLIGVAAFVSYQFDPDPAGLIERVELLVVHIWFLILAGGLLYATRAAPAPVGPTPLRPRQFFGTAWSGEGQVFFRPAFLGRWFARPFRCRREITWLTDDVWLVEDRADLGGGWIEERRFYFRLVAPDRIEVTGNDLPDGAEVLLTENGYSIFPYRVVLPVGPVRFTGHARDHHRVEPDGTVVDTIDARWLGIPLIRVAFRVRLERE